MGKATRLTVLLLACLALATLVACDQSAPAAPLDTTLAIEGMHCDACAESIHQTVTAMPGIESCSVSYADGQADLRSDNRAALEAAIERIRAMGFTVEPEA